MDPLTGPAETNISSPIELAYQKYLVNVCMVIALPALTFFMIHDMVTGNYVVGMILLLMLTLILGLFFVIRSRSYKTEENRVYQYFLTSLFVFFGGYLIYAIGLKGDLSRMPWAYIFPVMVFFALGAGRAFVWVSILISILAVMTFIYPARETIVPGDLKIRFYISFVLVIIATYFFERLKKNYQQQLIDNQLNLKESESRYRAAYEQLNNEMKERQRAEEALRESEERFRELAELMPETIFEADLEGELTFVNRKAYDHFGYSDADFERGLNAFDMIVPQDRDRAAENILNILNGEKIGLSEYTAQRKDGSTFPILIHSAAIVREGKVCGIRGFIIDHTERKQSEEEKQKLEVQFQQAQRLETIGTLAGGIAHDFNNLLMTIQGNTSLMLFDTNISHPHYESLKNIEKQIERGAKLTKQLLGYARKGKYNVKPLNLNHIVKESSETFGRTRKEIRIYYKFDPELFTVEADQGQIEQILYNLYVNAADAMPGGGKLVLMTTNVTHEDIQSEHYNPLPGNYVRLTVSDTGTGMDAAVKERIFDPFFTTKETGRGTGLGLASVYGITKSHDGYIEVETRRGEGSTFNIYLPASGKEVLKSPEARSNIYAGSGNILLVDDEAMVLDVASRVLEKLGYTVLKAQSGKAAVKMFEQNKESIDLVILDIIMPDMGGEETYDRIKKMNPRVKVLLSSGYSIDGQATEIMKRGCDGFIQKPFKANELSETLKKILTEK